MTSHVFLMMTSHVFLMMMSLVFHLNSFFFQFKLVFLNIFFGVPHLATFIYVILIVCNSLASLTSIQYAVPRFELTTS